MPFPNDPMTKDTIISHFKRKKIAYTEDGFLSVINNEKSSRYDVYWAVIGLRDTGTEKSIEALKKLLFYPMQDVKDTSILTLCHIAREKETEFYCQALLDKKTRKDYPMWAILDAADERAIGAVCQYLTDVYKKWKQPKCLYAGTAYIEGLLYLERYYTADSPINEVFQLYRTIRDKIPSGAVDRIQSETEWCRKILFEN